MKESPAGDDVQLRAEQMLCEPHFCSNKKLEENGMGMRIEKRFQLKLIVLLILVIILVIILTGRMNRSHVPGEYSTQHVGIEEIKSELGVFVYTEEEWEDYFTPYFKNYLTGDMLDQLLQKLGVDGYIENKNHSQRGTISREEWNLIYDQLLDYLDTERVVEKKTYLVLDTMEADTLNVIITNQGDIYTSLPVSYFKKWTAYELYMREEMNEEEITNETCLGISGESGEETSIGNAYLKTVDEDGITFLYGGAEYQKETRGLPDVPSNGVCDLVLINGSLDTIRMKQDVIQGELLSYDAAAIEIKGYGSISHQGKLPVYQTYGDVVEKSISDVILGNMEVSYVTGGGEVCAVLIHQPANIENIRVLLLADGGGKYRNDVYLKCNVSSVINYGEQETRAEAETLIHVTEYLTGDTKLTFSMNPEDINGMITICDGNGTALSNGYYGSMEVRAYPEGYTLVNQLPFETYLYAVVPSEMPSTYETEALKAQAVCARSYAYIQLMRADLAQFGAHINDSTSYQVYNKVPWTQSAVDAVNATSGQVLSYQGEIIEAYYFSTSMGYTDTVEVWNVENTENYGYLQAVCLNESAYDGDLSDESQFLTYISNQGNGYDSSIKYYRWFASADYRQKTGEINEILNNRRTVSKRNVLYYESDGALETDSTAGMGDIKGFSVTERSKSGSILTLRIQYENGIVDVKSEYNIRKVLGCGMDKIVYADSSESQGTGMLPSASAAIVAQEDGTYLLQGGGYGHGLGMSQNGANGMAKAGIGYEEILQTFYHETEIENMIQ